MAKLRVKEIAEAKGVLQSHLQLEARVTPPLLSRYWNNKTSSVDLIELEKIARALGVAPGELIVADEEETTEEQPDGKKEERNEE